MAINAWVVADDEAYLVRLAGAGAAPGRAATVATESLDEIATKLRSAGPSVVDVSSAYTILRLVGRRLPGAACRSSARSTRRLAPCADLRIVQAPVVGVRMVIARRDHGDIPGWILLVARDDAEFVWDSIVDLGAVLRAATGRHAGRPAAGSAEASAPAAIGATGAPR